MTDNSRVRSKDDEVPPGGAAHSPLRRAFVWGVAVLTFVGTLEMATRVDDWLKWGAPLVGAYSHSALFGVDSIGWRPRPGAQFEKWQINQHGFRGPEVDVVPKSGTIRVAVLGASETFGQAESVGHEFPRALERLLNQKAAGELGGRTFEVINAGIPGMSVGRIGEYWNHWVSRFEPDVVVVYASPGFYLGNSPPADRNPRSEAEASAPRDAPRFPGKLRMVLNQFIPDRAQAHLKRFLIYRERARHAEGWVWHEVPGERLALFERHFRGLVSDLDDAGVVPVLVTHARAVKSPDSDAEGWATLVGWQKFQPRAEIPVILQFEDRVNETIVRVGKEMGALVARADEAVPPGSEYFSDHQHFTDAGAEVAASAIAAVIHDALRLTIPSVSLGEG